MPMIGGMASGTCEICYGRLALLRHLPRNHLDIGRCKSCGLVTVLNDVSASDAEELYADGENYRRYLAAQRGSLQRWHAATLDRLALLVHAQGRRPQLYDVGAGAGDFLVQASAAGFDVAGNETSGPAIRLCRERHGIELSPWHLATEAGRDRFDAMTMWCVLAHVPIPRALLRDVLRLLRPGGVLYFHTPRWCLIDTLGLMACRLSGDRLSQLTERRINLAHLRLYGKANMTILLESVGFEIIAVDVQSAYSLEASAYLSGMGFSAAMGRSISRGLDQLIDRGYAPRNVLEIYVRKPDLTSAVDRRSGVVPSRGTKV